MSAVTRAGAAQQTAAHPAAHVFAQANAGSGKTKVLVDRVARLLLSGAAPETILCLTYTKAAAGEMKSRLFGVLGRWSVASDDSLTKALHDLTGIEGADRKLLSEARKLFARALETPGGLSVQTIHSFCERLLRRFPVEAGLPPGFGVADGAAEAEIARAARAEVLRACAGDAALNAALEACVAISAEALDNLFAFAAANRHEIAAFDAPDAMSARLRDALSVPPGLTAQQAMAAAWDAAPKAALESAAAELEAAEKPTDRDRGAVLRAALASAGPASAFDVYLTAFLTKKGEPQASVCTKGFAGAHPEIAKLLADEQDRMVAARDRVRALRVAEASEAAMTLAPRYAAAFAARLQRARKVDFADQIDAAAALLTRAGARDWVRYKMDGGVAHILVDEAQDTAPKQWAVIRALAEEFFSGEGHERWAERPRTLFCVGDEKQSIYSFQGADPGIFSAAGLEMREMAAAAGQAYAAPALTVSFRSAPQVLAAVDAAFRPEAHPPATAAAGAAPEVKFLAAAEAEDAGPAQGYAAPHAFTAYHAHEAAFSGAPGCAEIWPLVPAPERREDPHPLDPVDAEAPNSARNRLAAILAGEIKAMLDRGDAVQDGPDAAPRPVGPQDVMVLVRQRSGGFFDELIRQLKKQRVPVAGADRMVLTQQTVAQDLVTLAKFALNPQDDLNLAELLKSPFFQPKGGPMAIDDAALFDLAHKRPSTLWEALRVSDDVRFAEAKVALEQVRAVAETRGVHAFFAAFLNAPSPSGDTYLARLFNRLGEEARDAAEEFLARALLHERETAPSLARFIAGIAADAGEIRREMEEARGAVRVMTVHGSKGLEAPVVILPDTTSAPGGRRGDGLFLDAGCGIVWSPTAADDPPWVAEELRLKAALVQTGEHARLLYVALTRARQRVIVCGWAQGNRKDGFSKDSWYARLDDLWRGADWTECESPVRAEDGTLLAARRFGPAPDHLGPQTDSVTAVAVPGWASAPAPAEAPSRRPVAPSHLAEDAEPPPALSPLQAQSGARYRRGALIHKLLQTLPDLPEARRAQAAAKYLSAQADLSEDQRAEIAAETLRVIAEPAFAALFGPGSRAEVGLAGAAPGLPAGTVLYGQADRLVVTDHEVLIVDYKTNRPPPARAEEAGRAYLAQMAGYRALLRAIHPGKTVRCALLWTDGPSLMALPDALLDQALAPRTP